DAKYEAAKCRTALETIEKTILNRMRDELIGEKSLIKTKNEYMLTKRLTIDDTLTDEILYGYFIRGTVLYRYLVSALKTLKHSNEKKQLENDLELMNRERCLLCPLYDQTFSFIVDDYTIHSRIQVYLDHELKLHYLKDKVDDAVLIGMGKLSDLTEDKMKEFLSNTFGYLARKQYGTTVNESQIRLKDTRGVAFNKNRLAKSMLPIVKKQYEKIQKEILNYQF
ncbi:hypothetical protein JXA85_05120, partial [Candidatus Woesearchaeota archaeon]|nr:hypothetical protein [Candidatus Woesearchaeota archaeon]